MATHTNLTHTYIFHGRNNTLQHYMLGHLALLCIWPLSPATTERNRWLWAGGYRAHNAKGCPAVYSVIPHWGGGGG